MLPSLFTGISGLQSHQQLLSVVSDNLANVNTVAFKASRGLFQNTLSQTIKSPTEATGTQPGGLGIQIGLGVGMSSVAPNFSQGGLRSTGLPTDLAMEGEGFLVVRDPASNGTFYTRAGSLGLDSNNKLIDSNGYIVQGFQVPNQATPTTPTDGDAYQDLIVAPDTNISAALSNFSIESSGRILMALDDGTSVPAGYIATNNFANSSALLAAGSNVYTATPAAGVLYTGYKGPGTGGMGAIRSGFLELSNVDLSTEFTDMIRSQRGLQANSRSITTSDEILQELLNLKR